MCVAVFGSEYPTRKSTRDKRIGIWRGDPRGESRSEAKKHR